MEALLDQPNFPGFLRMTKVFDVVITVNLDEAEFHVSAVVVLYLEFSFCYSLSISVAFR